MGCYWGAVVGALYGCYWGVIGALLGCYWGVVGVLLGCCYWGVIEVCLRRYWGVIGALWGRYGGVLGRSHTHPPPGGRRRCDTRSCPGTADPPPASVGRGRAGSGGAAPHEPLMGHGEPPSRPTERLLANGTPVYGAHRTPIPPHRTTYGAQTPTYGAQNPPSHLIEPLMGHRPPLMGNRTPQPIP